MQFECVAVLVVAAIRCGLTVINLSNCLFNKKENGKIVLYINKIIHKCTR